MFKKPGTMLMEDDDLSGAGAPGNGDKDKTTDSGSEELKLLGKAVGFLAQGFEELKKQTAGYAEGQAKLTALVETLGKPADRKEVQKDIFDGVDLENMTDAEKLKYVMAKMNETIEERVSEGLKQHDKKLTDLADAFNQKNSQEAVAAMVKDNADFFEWAPEMKALLSEQPNLTVRQAYVLVRAENPKKLAEMTKKYTKEEGEIGKRRASYGLTPTSSSRGDAGGKMKPQEAAEKAFEDIMGPVLAAMNS